MKRHFFLLPILILLVAFAAQVTTALAASSLRAPTFAAFDLHHPLEIEDDEGEAEDELEAGGDELELEECEAGILDLEIEDEEELAEAEEELEEECDATTRKKTGGDSSDGQDGAFVTAPAACRVNRVESTITAMPVTDQVRLVVRYRTWEPTPVMVSLKLRDRKGAFPIEHATRKLGDHGVFRITTKLGSSVMDRAVRASEFDVSLLAPDSPAYCAGSLEQRLRSVKHTSGDAPRVYSN